MNSEKQEALRKLLEQGLQDYSLHRSDLAQLPGEVQAGDIFLFKLPDVVPVSWCAIFQHSKDSTLWFVVPGDDFSLVGTHDIAVPGRAGQGPLNLRCACGLWVHEDDFQLSNRIGSIHSDYVEQVRDHLSRMLENDLPTAESLVNTDDDPDYLEWIKELSAAVAAFENHLLNFEDASEVIVVSTVSATRGWYETVQGLSSELSLAADSGGPETESGTPPAGIPVPFAGEGDLIVLVYDQGISLQLFNSNKSLIPAVFAGASDTETVAWHKQPNWLSTPLIAWSGDELFLRVNEQRFVIQHHGQDD